VSSLISENDLANESKGNIIGSTLSADVYSR